MPRARQHRPDPGVWSTRNAKPRRNRLCVWHAQSCRWAGGDGAVERHDAALVAAIRQAKGLPATAVGHVHGFECRQATERDRQREVGIFSPPTPPDPELAAMILTAKERNIQVNVGERNAQVQSRTGRQA